MKKKILGGLGISLMSCTFVTAAKVIVHFYQEQNQCILSGYERLRQASRWPADDVKVVSGVC